MKKASEKVTLNIKEFDVASIPLSCTIMLVAPPGSGKTVLMEYIAYCNKHRYIGGRAFVGTADAYKKWSHIFHPLFTSNYYDTDEEALHIRRQNHIELQNARGYMGNYVINILDDVADDASILHSKEIISLFKNGSQHYAQLLMLGTQTCMDVPPAIRTTCSYAIIGRFLNPNDAEKLFKNFGGAVNGDKALFMSLLKQITGDHIFLVLKLRNPSGKIEDNVFWIKGAILPSWKMGCKEYREWAERRYNKDFKEEF